MPDYFIIAAGGTGAMCARSFIHLAAAGCARRDATYHLLLIDKDKDSDARIACEKLVDYYKRTRECMGQMPEIRLYDWSLSDAILAEYEEKNNRPAGDLGVMNLNNLLNPNDDPNVDLVLRSLYTEAELNLNIDEGFYGHPNIGSAVFSYIENRLISPPASKKGDEDFILKLKGSLCGGRTYVYLFASLFGGTGATIVPNMVRLLRSLKSEANRDLSENLVLGCGVIMPYFRLPSLPDNDPEMQFKIHPQSELFDIQTREALTYYSDCNLTQDLMNLTLIGNHEPDVTSEIYARGGEQKQHYHMTLQIAAVVANMFFANGLGLMKNLGRGENADTTAGEVFLWGINPENDGQYRTLTPSELGLRDDYLRLNKFLHFSVIISIYLYALVHNDYQVVRDSTLVKITVENEWQAHYKDAPILKPIPEVFIKEHYQIPVEQISDYCREFIDYYYDVSLSGYNWAENDRKNFFENANNQRWVDAIGIACLHRLRMLSKDPSQSEVNSVDLTLLFSYSLVDDKRQPVKTEAEGSLAHIFNREVLSKHTNVFGNVKGGRETDMQSIFKEIYEYC